MNDKCNPTTDPVTMLDAPAKYDSNHASTWAVGFNTASTQMGAEIQQLRERVKDLQQFHDWASPQVHDHGRDVLEITRLRQYLGYISRMKCHPDKVATMTTLAAAIQLAEQALSGEPSREAAEGIS